ncbi:MAG: peroxiredoxin [Candidatus Dojkabacteria bacterium]|nr:peroxiredoxin [Candidatus Dojkabacteria bacterium]
MVKVGDFFPVECDCNLQDINGNIVRVSDILKFPAVIFFYPKDFTPGCTQEVCGFRDNYDAILSLGFNLYAINADSPGLHKRFVHFYKINYPVYSDKDKKLLKMVGILNEKKMFGRKYYGITRSTFVVDGNGIIRAIWGEIDGSMGKINTMTHANQVLDFLKTLK